MAYATSAEYEAELGAGTAPANIERLLTLASRDVDAALIAAVYNVEDGAATDAAVITALKEATIEQAAYCLDTGDETGTGGSLTYTSVSIGSVALSRPQSGGAGGGSAARPLAPQARSVLQLAGLTGHEPYTYQTCAAADG
ncbi:hypothetical protein AB0F17_16055 [Nonomuraea sp. NPDC026600]|uniref:hypothetical protein n=1 Tax=Nonomuraea sp. NPDC026600 TaxID=3155363 RepID=UPI0033C0F938